MKYFFYPERRFVTFAPIMSNNPKSPIIDLQQQQLLLRMEYEYEKEEFKRQTETMGVARKVKRGLCWYPVSLGRSYYNSLNQLVIDITRTENKEIEHSFEFGRPVCFFHQSFEGKVKYMDFIATVSFADEERMVVVLPGAGALAELQTDGILGVQLYFDETSYRAMFEALEDTIRAKDNRLAELRDILLGTQKPGFRELYPVRFPWLNSTQETAVNKVLCTRDVSIVHGPPGTGKTTTLVEAIYETLHREPQVLVCAQSNTAVDWICEKLVDRGVPVLRIGNPTRVNDKMLSSTYERRFESHPAYPELWGIRKSIREMGSRMRRGSYSELILICLAIIILLLIIWFVYKKRPELFMRSPKNKLPYEVGEDTIYGVDFSGGIADALSRSDYREAVRLLYLQTLKRLSDEKRIYWQPYKTPTQYINEVRIPVFRQLTNHFLRVRYGNFEATEELFNSMKSLQEEIGKGGGS